MKKWISVGSAVALVGLGLLLYFGCPTAPKTVSVVEPTALPSASDLVMQVGVNGQCLAKSTREKNVLVSFRATPMLSAGHTVESSKSYAVAELGRAQSQGLVVDLNGIQGKVGKDFSSYLFSISICNDQNQDQRCDDPVLYQAFKMSGKYLKSVYPDGKLSIQLVNDAKLGC